MNLVVNSNVVAFKDRHGEIPLANCAIKFVVATVSILLDHSVGPNVGPVGIYYEVHGFERKESEESGVALQQATLILLAEVDSAA